MRDTNDLTIGASLETADCRVARGQKLPLRLLAAAVPISIAFVPGVASAQTIDDKFWIQISAFHPTADSDLQINGTTSDGTLVDFESDLDLDKNKTVPAIAAGFKLGKRWRVGLDYYSLSRKGSTTLARDIIVNDVTYPANGVVESGLSSDVYRLTVGYSFVQNETWDVGAALGFHVTDFTTSIEGVGVVAGQPVATQLRRRELLAPLPTVGLYLTAEVAPRVTIGARTDFMSLKINNYKGSLINSQANIQYRIAKNIGIGAMYRFVRYRLKVNKDDWEGRVGYRYSGPALFMEFGF